MVARRHAAGADPDVVVVGAGIVGLATALQLMAHQPGLSVLVVDKEREVAGHQSGHNSGVIHRGVYYTPGSLKARLCVQGADRLTAFCDTHGIPYRLPGKLIIAADESELPALDELQRRGEANGVPGLRRLRPEEIREVEPHATGVAALHSPRTGIVDFRRVTAAYATEIERSGGSLRLGDPVTAFSQRNDHVALRVGRDTVRTGVLVTCGGLQSDRLASMGRRVAEGRRVAIIPFRGDYFVLRPERSGLVRGLIYPVPDPRFPFLGVHLTPRMDGSVWLGPNAVLAFAREGYRRRDVSLRDLLTTLTFRGFWTLAARYWRTGAAEMWRDLSRGAFASALRRYVPDLRDEDLVGHASGVRAQAVSSEGALLDDFLVSDEGRIVHVLNAPSPAATSSLAIGDLIAERVLTRLHQAS